MRREPWGCGGVVVHRPRVVRCSLREPWGLNLGDRVRLRRSCGSLQWEIQGLASRCAGFRNPFVDVRTTTLDCDAQGQRGLVVEKGYDGVHNAVRLGVHVHSQVPRLGVPVRQNLESMVFPFRHFDIRVPVLA